MRSQCGLTYPPWFAFTFGYEFPDNGDDNVLVDDYY